MAKQFTRRRFLNETSKTTIAASVSILLGSDLIAACAPAKVLNSPVSLLSFDQTPLPYTYNALEPFVDALTMEIHYSKHAAAYSKNAKDAAAAESVDINKPIEQLLASISKYSAKMRNNAGGHYNHELFWKCMNQSGVVQPSANLTAALTKAFGSIEAFKNQFADAGKNRFGSGWAWLYADKDKQLRIGSSPNQDNPLMDVSDIKGTPLLGLDVWEHAYYLKYQNKRADYITAWWNVANWNFVQQRFEAL